MTKHVADQPRSRGDSRLRAFLAQERAQMPSPATLGLQSRPKARDDNGRKAGQYLRIARGKEA